MMSETRQWLVISGALALGASAAVLTGSLGGEAQSEGPGVTLNPAASASAVRGQDPKPTILATVDDVTGADDGAGTALASADSPASPASLAGAVSPESAD